MRGSTTGPFKSTGGFEVGAGGSGPDGTNTPIIDSDGNFTVPGTLSVTGVSTLTGAVAGLKPYSLKADDYIVTAAESGTVFGMATDAKEFTLPAVAAGLTYTFVNTGAADNNLVDISIADGVISGTFTLAASVVEVSVATTIRNTKTGSVKGDSVTLTSDGTGWFITASTGIWAQQAP